MVREARLERHLSMGQLAAAVDRSTASVRRWERDDGLPTQEVVDILVLRLQLDPAEVDAVVAETRGEPLPVAVEQPAPSTVEKGDPIDVVPVVGIVEAADGDAASRDSEPDEPASPMPAPAPPLTVTAPPPSTVWPTASAPVAVVERQDQNILQILRDPDRPWLGYIRAALTLAVLGGLLYVLVWAVPEFLDAFGEAWDSLWPDTGTSV